MFSDYDIYDRQRLRLHCVITLQSPLSHIGEVSGNVSNLKTAKLIDLEGRPRSCFVYSGNALRNGVLRRRGTAAAMDALGLQTSPDVHHTLFAGGRLDRGVGNDMGLDTRIRQLMPWLSVLGTAKPANVFGAAPPQMIHGRIAVGSAYLVCYESAEMIYREFPGLLPPDAVQRLQGYLESRSQLASNPFSPPSEDAAAHFEEVKRLALPYIRKALPTWTEYLTIDQTTRRDSTHDPALQRFLPTPPVGLLAGDQTEGAEGAKKSTQMIASDRLIMAGAKLYSRWDLYTTDVETGWIVDTLLQFAESPYLGGKSNRGNGLVSMDFWYQRGEERGHFLTVATGQSALSESAGKAHNSYCAYLSQYQKFLADAKESDAIRGLLNAQP
ncbi:MAG: hypothetical protein HC910_22435 [Spirulinaceae cyanobacterium SM2_1_0]|nr:hypothetical protein [Spirulinaceae cyanobacterium SM2_1_0]